MVTLYLVRHGEVHNPTGIIYGRLPGFGLNPTGRVQIEKAAEALAGCGPFQALYASPLQRAQESASILADRLRLAIETDERLVETGIGGYQGKTFDTLPRPYITENSTHEGIESAASIRTRMLDWVDAMQTMHPGQQIVAVSHRDPIIVTLLSWMGRKLAELPEFGLATGGVYEVQFTEVETSVRRVPT